MKELIKMYENLFEPINNKDIGKYWKISNNKMKALANGTELYNYTRKEIKHGNFINRYANLESDSIIENNIYLDFDLTSVEYLKQEKDLTEKAIRKICNGSITSKDEEKEIHQQIKNKFNNNYDNLDGYYQGYNSFIESLTINEISVIVKLVKSIESDILKGLKNDEEIRKYFIEKFEKDYLKEPFTDVIKTAKYFESIGIETIINSSGSKGYHLRIPITELEIDSDYNRLFLLNLAELIETKILEKPYKTSSLDYNVFSKGMQRIPATKHDKTKLYGNFINNETKYLESIDYLTLKEPYYIPNIVDKETNTSKFINSAIYKKALDKATNETVTTFDGNIVNAHYEFNSNDTELTKMIKKIYIHGFRNEVGFRIVHLLKRSGFKKIAIEDIFKNIHGNIKDYNTTIKGAIDHAFKTEKLVGLNNLLKWIEDNSSAEVKDEVISYFKKEFNFYDKPVESEFKDKITYDSKEYVVKRFKSSKDKYYLINDFIEEGIDLKLILNKHLIISKDKKKIHILRLKPNSESIEIKSEKLLKSAIKKIESKIAIKIDFEDLLSELEILLYDEINVDPIEIQKKKIENKEKQLKSNSKYYSNFGEKENGTEFFTQNKVNGIDFVKVKGSEDKTSYKVTNLAKCYFKKIIKTKDELGILEPVYTVTLHDLTTKEDIIIKKVTSKELIEEIKILKVFKDENIINEVVNTFIIDNNDTDFVENKKQAYLNGYFLVNGKVVENSPIKNLNYNKEDVKKAIELLNEIMINRSDEGKRNDSAVYRLALVSPFSYCLKQLGYTIGIKSIILIGKSKTNKTGAFLMGNKFYNFDNSETSGATLSVLGSKLEEDTFMKGFDECFNLLNSGNEVQDVMKKAVDSLTTRITKNRTDNKKMDTFNAFGLPVFILNEDMYFKDFIYERYNLIEYTTESFISKDERREFNEKYLPKSKNTILNNLKFIGAIFRDKIIPLIESKDVKLLDLEKTVIDILKEIATEVKVDFIDEMYQETESSDYYAFDETTLLKRKLNDEFKKKNFNVNSFTADIVTFINSAKKHDFDFIYFKSNNADKPFFIHQSNFKKYANKILESNLNIIELLDMLDIKKFLESECENELKEKNHENIISDEDKFNKYFKEYISKSVRINDKSMRGFYLDKKTLITKMFSFDISVYKDSEDEDKKENNT